MRVEECIEASEHWWRAYDDAQQTMGAANAMLAEALAKQVMLLAEMLTQSFDSALSIHCAIADIQQEVTRVLLEGENGTCGKERRFLRPEP